MRSNVVDGANGFVGANLVNALLADGQSVIALARRPSLEVQFEIENAVFGRLKSGQMERLRVLQHSLSQPDLGLSPDGLQAVFAEPCDFWHLAAFISFAPGRYDDLVTTNIDGTRNALETFHRYAKPGSRFFHVSTAYSCGIATEPVAERWHESAPPSHFRNFYEYSKREAELVFRDFQQRHGVQGVVLRLGQVVGNSVTGESTTTYGIYQFMRSVWSIVRNRPGEQVRIESDPATMLHLVPIYSCVRLLMAIAKADLQAFRVPIFHVVGNRPVPGQKFLDAINKCLGVHLTSVPVAVFDSQPRNRMERLIEARMKYLGKYIAQALAFDTSQVTAAVGEHLQSVTGDVVELLVSRFFEQLQSNQRDKVYETAV